MTPKDIIDGLEACGGSDYCGGEKCPYYNTWPAAECFMRMCFDAAGLIRDYVEKLKATEEEYSERTEAEHSPK